MNKHSTVLLVSILLISTPIISATSSQDTSSYHFELNIIQPSCGGIICYNQANHIENDLRSIGIDITILNTGWNTVASRTWAYSDTVIPAYDDGGYDTLLLSYGFRSKNFIYPSNLHSSNLGPDDNGFHYNIIQYSNSTMDNLIEQYRSTYDRDELINLATQIQRLSYDDMATIPLYEVLRIIPVPVSITTDHDTIRALEWFHNSDDFKYLNKQNDSTITIGSLRDFDVFSPLLDGYSFPEYSYPKAIWQPLYEWNPVSKNFVPLLADNLPRGSQNEITFSIRNGVTFSDGTALSADHIVESFRYQLSPVFNPDNHNDFAEILNNNSITKISEDTVKIEFLNWKFDFMNYLTIPILPTHIWGPANNSQIPNLQLNQAIFSNYSYYGIGTGPFIYDSISNSNVNLIKNQNYWNGDVMTDHLHYESFQSLGTIGLVEQQIDQNVDFISSIVGHYMQYFDQYTSQFDFVNISSGNIYSFELNHNNPVFGTGEETPLGMENPDLQDNAARYVRKAIFYAINRSTLLHLDETSFNPNGYGIITNSLWSSSSLGYWNNYSTDDYDIEKARHYLSLAGYQMSGSDPVSNNNDSSFYVGLFLLIPIILKSRKRD